MPEITIDLPDALLDCLDAIAERDYGDRDGVIRRLLARGAYAELDPRNGPVRRRRAPDGPGDPGPLVLASRHAFRAPFAPIYHPTGRPFVTANRGMFVNIGPTEQDIRDAYNAGIMMGSGEGATRARLGGKATMPGGAWASVGPMSTCPGVTTGARRDPVAMVGDAMRNAGIVPRPSPAWDPPVLSDEEEALRLAHAARRLREQRIARGLDPDTGRAPVTGNTDAAVIVRTAERGNLGASEDDVTPSQP